MVAGWDHDSARLAAAAGKHALVMCDSAESLLARADVQAVAITAETSHHAELVELAAAAGKAIILQKPMALTLAEADRIVAVVELHRGRSRWPGRCGSIRTTSWRATINTNLDWHGQGVGPVKTSKQAYVSMYISCPTAAKSPQAKEFRTQRGAKKLGCLL